MEMIDTVVLSPFGFGKNYFSTFDTLIQNSAIRNTIQPNRRLLAKLLFFSGEEGTYCIDDDIGAMMAALFQDCKNAHQNRLCFGTVFSHDHAVANRSFGVIVVTLS